ncbi:MAG: hypothetical protein JWL86_3592 [Rhizobium sp.]|nr:hypothetical protein [Rhizobium sp.]
MITKADDVIEYLGRATTLDSVRTIGDAVQGIKDVRLRNVCIVNGTTFNPFFVPHGEVSQPTLNATQWLYVISQARITAANTRTRRVMVAAPMKSGSTFVSKALATALDLPRTSLIMLLARAYDYTVYGAAMRPHEIDELALLSACCRPSGFVAHHHMLASPFLCRQASLYGLDVILIRRNIFDMLVSLDDFQRKYGEDAAAAGTDNFFHQGLPENYRHLDFDARISRLLDRNLNFYVSYYVSWTLAEQSGLIEPFWISYEDEIAANATALAARMSGVFAKTEAEEDEIARVFSKGGDMDYIHFNKGVAGRGSAITGANRARVLEAFADFDNVADWSEILD